MSAVANNAPSLVVGGGSRPPKPLQRSLDVHILKHCAVLIWLNAFRCGLLSGQWSAPARFAPAWFAPVCPRAGWLGCRRPCGRPSTVLRFWGRKELASLRQLFFSSQNLPRFEAATEGATRPWGTLALHRGLVLRRCGYFILNRLRRARPMRNRESRETVFWANKVMTVKSPKSAMPLPVASPNNLMAAGSASFSKPGSA